MVIEESILIRGSIGKVWKTFTDLTCWADWNTVLRDVSGKDVCIQEGARFRCCLRPFVFPVYFEPEIEEVVPFRKIAWRGRKFGILARHEYLFAETENGVLVTSREVFSGQTITMAGPVFPEWRIKELTVSLLRDLKKEVEAENERDELERNG